ncbi:hypothetical protein D3C78_791300 [compost metagenome]
MRKVASTVAASIPPITPVPIEWRLAEPAPALIASGTQPRMNASEVITIGRKRSLDASSAASNGPMPFSSRIITANSMIRMAFFAARPIRVTRPTWKYTSLSSPRSQIARIAPNTAKGTAVTTASGRVQRSYWAARMRNTRIRPKTNAVLPEPWVCSSW